MDYFWAGQAAIGLGLLISVYKTNEILTVLQKQCSRCRVRTGLVKRLIKTMKFECVCHGPGQLEVSRLSRVYGQCNTI